MTYSVMEQINLKRASSIYYLDKNSIHLRQFMTLDLMKDLYTRTTLLICILEENTNINGFALTTNVVECLHKILKNNGHQTTQVMKSVIKDYIKEQASS